MKSYLKPNREKPFEHGHPWVFSGALKQIEGTPADGDELALHAADGRFIAWGLFNSRSQIRLRLYSWRESERLNEAFFHARLKQVLRLREELFPAASACRLVNSEGDGLSGLVVDRYGGQLVVQLSSLALARRAPMLLALLQNLAKPKAVLLRTDDSLSREEGLEPLELVAGEPRTVKIEEHGLSYIVTPAMGQKTGFFLDQRDNRLAVRTPAAGRRCLDVCCYTGGFALNMAAAGATQVIALDASATALETAAANAALNGLPVDFVRNDAFDYLKRAAEAGERYGCIVLDPPKFAGGRDTAGAKGLHQPERAGHARPGAGRLFGNLLVLRQDKPSAIPATGSHRRPCGRAVVTDVGRERRRRRPSGDGRLPRNRLPQVSAVPPAIGRRGKEAIWIHSSSSCT